MEQADLNEFERRTADFIASRHLLRSDAPVIVALSGGADSVALIAVLLRPGYDCRAAHCNFHLRGDESMRDMNHCRAVAEALDVDLYVRDFDVAARRSAFPGESVEMACRELRYCWFADLLDRECAQAVAVGHHREDRAETFMLNLMRGAGIAGLTSMRPRSGNVVRPLLPFSRLEIERYLEQRNLGFINDSSNASDVHRRNRLRNNIFPALEAAFPGALDAVLRTVANLESANSIYMEAVEQKRNRYFSGTAVRLAALVAAEPEAATLLLEFLRPLGFTYSQICDMISVSGASGAHFRSTDGTVVAEISHGKLSLFDASRLNLAAGEVYSVNPLHDIMSPVRITVSRMPVSNFFAEGLGPSVAYFDAAVLDGEHRWELRHYRRGDRMVPFGAKKSKLLSDIFAGAHYSAEQKRRAWLLTRDDEIVWLPGLRNSALFAVGPGTKEYIRMQYFEEIRVNQS